MWKGIISTTWLWDLLMNNMTAHELSIPIQIWIQPHLTKRNWQFLAAKIIYLCSARMFSKGQMAAEAIVEVLSILEVRWLQSKTYFDHSLIGPVFLLVFLGPGVYICNPRWLNEMVSKGSSPTPVLFFF